MSNAGMSNLLFFIDIRSMFNVNYIALNMDVFAHAVNKNVLKTTNPFMTMPDLWGLLSRVRIG